MPVQRYACGVEYHGAHFAGWQVQAKARSVEAILQTAVEQVADHPVSLIVAGRTDAGVHALSQVVHFDSSATRSLRGWTFGINTALPSDVSLTYLRPVPMHFHARYSAEARSYTYLIFNRRERSALAAGRACWQSRPLDVARMQAAAGHLIGTHDFSAFRSSQCQSRSPLRRLEQLQVQRRAEWITITATANAFLHHMVRNLAGLLIQIGQRGEDPVRAADVLAARDRRLNAPTAPADGLYLAAVRYPLAFALPVFGYDVGALLLR
jgi:tRNA pseudouridine38-40 synthase